MENKTFMPPMSDTSLEPRVARLETGLEQLAKNVSEMATAVRENASSTNTKIDNLIVAVTQAQAPKKTDWGVFISAIGLIVALGAAVLIPLNNATQDNKQAIEKYHESMVDHMKLDMHPVGQAKVDALVREVEVNRAEMAKRDEQLDIKIQKETQLMTDLLSARLEALDKRLQIEMGLKNDLFEQKIITAKDKYDLFFEKLYGRVMVLEQLERDHNAKDSDELRELKMRIMTGELKYNLPVEVGPKFPVAMPPSNK